MNLPDMLTLSKKRNVTVSCKSERQDTREICKEPLEKRLQEGGDYPEKQNTELKNLL